MVSHTSSLELLPAYVNQEVRGSFTVVNHSIRPLLWFIKLGGTMWPLKLDTIASSHFTAAAQHRGSLIGLPGKTPPFELTNGPFTLILADERTPSQAKANLLHPSPLKP